METGRLSWSIFLLALCLGGPSAQAVPTHFVGVNAHQPQTDVLDAIKDLEEQLKRAWWTHTFFYEIVDDNNIADKWGMAVRSGASPTYPASYQKKPVWGLLHDVLAQQPALGGSGTDCSDGLDNDGDKLIDYPADPQCGSASDPTETPGTAVPDAGPPDTARDTVTVLDGPPSDAPTLPRETSTVDGPRVDAAGDSGAATGDDGCSCSQGARPAVGPTALMLLAAIAVLLARRRPGRRTPGC